jgi:ribose transport system ATP-binding protein
LLHQNTDIQLLDKPTRGIDIGNKVQVYETIADCIDENKAVLMVISYLPELFKMCDCLSGMSRRPISPVESTGEWTPESLRRAAVGNEENPES